jgi:hypothetical protein
MSPGRASPGAVQGSGNSFTGTLQCLGVRVYLRKVCSQTVYLHKHWHKHDAPTNLLAHARCTYLQAGTRC